MIWLLALVSAFWRFLCAFDPALAPGYWAG